MATIVRTEGALSEREALDVYALAQAAAARADYLHVQDLAFYRAFHGAHGATFLVQRG